MINVGLNDLVDKLDFDTPSSLPKLGVYKVALHVLQMLLAFITLCITASVIAAENAYKGSSQAAPNYTLAVTLITLFVSAPLAIFPWTAMSKKGLTAIRNFFLRPRTTVIFTCFMTMGWFAAMISMTVHSTNASNCALDDKLKKDQSYVHAWSKQCNSAKASAAFCWIAFFVAVATVVCSAVLLWHEKKLRHAELNNQVNAADATANKEVNGTSNDSSSTTYDDDARTIVDMKYSEKDQQPIANYEGSLTSVSPRVSPQPQDAHVARSYMSSPSAAVAVSTTDSVNDFALSYSSPAPMYSPLSAPYTPSSAMTPVSYTGSPYPATNTYIPQQQQPYSPYQASSPYASHDSPYSYHQQAPSAPSVPIITSPYPGPSLQQAYPSSPLYQQTPSAMYQTTTPSPLSQQHSTTASMHQQPSNYIPQEYNPHLANI
ncbi:hypothetical protein MAM1_0205c07970 [Mucor ambiguus]|uniref:MARVEL domain-containing protein n=1 Tax=Mucor ambiguus TaxID=91626 RepID=A0A0C9N1J1_9FUNG|nr:hypothetical protein MAM1_0205c07970 [Mucor ambiguus]